MEKCSAYRHLSSSFEPLSECRAGSLMFGKKRKTIEKLLLLNIVSVYPVGGGNHVGHISVRKSRGS